MKPVLVASLPWNLADMMSIQVGALKAFLREKAVDAHGRHYYLLTKKYFSDEEIDVVHTRMLGDHLYSMLLLPQHADRVARSIARRCDGAIDAKSCARRLKQLTTEAVEDMCALEPGLVGMTTTHMQYCGALFTSKVLKAKRPNVKVVLGGLSLWGPPARATVALFDHVDYIISGEGETALWRLAQHVAGELPVEQVPQLLYRRGTSIEENTQSETIRDIDSLPLPDYSDYFDTLATIERHVDPRATIEMVRGCRWGRCSFCVEGLPSRGGFRAKSPARVASEIRRYASDYRILDFVVSDPDVAFNAATFDEVRRLGIDLSFTVELSGLVRVPHFEQMVQAGLKTVQIGIESFSSSMLKKLNKGVSLCKYIRLLRACSDWGLELVYNNIYRAPFETQADLDEAAENMERLMYFQPPRLSTFNVSLGSQILAEPAKYGIKKLVPSEELAGYPRKIAEQIGALISTNAGYGFVGAEKKKINYRRYLQTIDMWREVWSERPQRVARWGAGFVRFDYRVGAEQYSVTVDDPLQIELLEFCQELRTRKDVVDKFGSRYGSAIGDAIEYLWGKHLLFRTADECVALVSLPLRQSLDRQSTDQPTALSA